MYLSCSYLINFVFIFKSKTTCHYFSLLQRILYFHLLSSIDYIYFLTPVSMEMMFTCFHCNQVFSKSDTLLHHIKLMHSLLHRFDCKQENCFRSFSTISDLRKHFSTNHNDLRSNTQPNLEVSSVFASIANISSSKDKNTLPKIQKNKDEATTDQPDENLRNEILSLLGRLYSIPSLPRNIVQLVLDHISELFNTISEFMEKLIAKSKTKEDISLKFTQMSKNVKHTFICLRSEYLRLKYFENCQSYIKPETFKIGEYSTLQKVNTPHPPNLVFKKAEGQIIPLRKVLKSFLELPGIFNNIISFINTEMSAPPDLLSSFMQGNLWKTIKKYFEKDTIVLPLLLYFDDFECCNPLGSKAGIYKIGAVYVSLACIPVDYVSLLENIFLAELFYSSDRTYYGNERCFANLMKELDFLEKEGITIIVDSKELKVYFTLVLVLGDNLGLNSVLGFHESFSSTFFCRICKTSKEITKTQTTENISTLRTKESYDNDASTLSYGIKEVCIFHQLQYFHCTKNVSLDLMHDVLEGILRYDMAHILNYLINIKKYFSLDNVNKRIQLFKFSEVDIGNPIPQIKADHIKNKHIVMSASEMLSFFSYFGILVGDLVPENDECWQLYINLHQILHILLSRVISKNTVQHLTYLIEEHHTLYCRLFSDTLKPKHHILLHYPNFILSAGPPRYLWSMRYEAFHKWFKSSANVVTSRKNILVTLAIKQQLHFSYRMISRKGFVNDIEYGPADDIISLDDYNPIYCLLKTRIEESLLENYCFSVPWLKSCNIMYKLGFVLQVSDDDIPKFGVIKYIIVIDNTVYFILNPLFVVGFNFHKQAYEILFDFENNLPCNNWILMFKSELINKMPLNIHYTGDGTKVIGIMQ